MASEVSDIAKQGYVRTRSRTLGLWQRRWVVFRRASSKGPSRLEKYLDERSARTSGSAHKVALLTNVVSVMRLTSNVRKHAFSLAFQDGTAKLIACDSDLEADTWVKLLIQECLVPQPGLATGEPDVLSPGIQKELQEQFHVYLMPTPKLEVFGECLLQVTHENIYLWDISNPRLKLVAWPLTALRRYGSDPTKFTFEAGRHCATGEGMFVFHTLEGEKIYRKVHQATLTIAEAHHRMRKGGTPATPDNASTTQLITPAAPAHSPSPHRNVQAFGTPLHAENEWSKNLLSSADATLHVPSGASSANGAVLAPSSPSLSSSLEFHLGEELSGAGAHLSCSLPSQHSQDSLLSLPPHHPRGSSPHGPPQGSVELPRRFNTPKCSLRSHLIRCGNGNAISNNTSTTGSTPRS